MKKKDVLSMRDFSLEEIEEVLDTAKQMKNSPPKELFRGSILGCCFFEPSTRTRLSFETAMKRLGGEVIGFSDAAISSSKKGESLADTIRVVGDYTDLIVLRHPLEGAASHVAEYTETPVINAGDGSNQHPTQTMLDLFTIRECQGRLHDLRIGFVGDLRYGRTIHSLVQACTHYGARLYFIHPKGLELPEELITDLRQKGILFSFHETLEEVLPKLDLLYVSRIQMERIPPLMQEQTHLQRYVVNIDMLKHVKDNFRILHPLPRVSDIDSKVDHTPYAYYFQQSKNGVPVRQALISLLLDQRRGS